MVTLIITNFTTGKKSRSTLDKPFDKTEVIIKRRLAKLAQSKNRFDAVVYGDSQQVTFRESDF